MKTASRLMQLLRFYNVSGHAGEGRRNMSSLVVELTSSLPVLLRGDLEVKNSITRRWYAQLGSLRVSKDSNACVGPAR